MTATAMTPIDDGTAQELSERLADVFRTGKANDVLADDLFLDGQRKASWKSAPYRRQWVMTLGPAYCRAIRPATGHAYHA